MLRPCALCLALAPFASAQELAAVTWTGSVMRIDATTGAVIQSISLFPTLQEVNSATRTPDGTWWVAADRGSRLVELDPMTGMMGASVQTTLDARGLACHPITGEVYSISISGELHRVDTSTGAATLVTNVAGSGFQSLAFTPDGRLWSWNISSSVASNGLWEIDPVTGAQLQHVVDPAGTIDSFQFLTAMPDGQFLVGRDDLYVVDPTTGVETFIGSPGGSIRGADLILPRALGSSFCGPAATNSTGGSATLAVTGDELASSNTVWLGCSGLPANSFGFFITSETTDFVANPGGSQGNLCLGGSIGRLSNQIVNSGAAGWVATNLDLAQVPTPTGTVAVTAGTTRHFSYWFRDANPATTSNFSDGRSVTFQ